MAGVDQFLGTNAADVACAARDEDVHGAIELRRGFLVTREMDRVMLL
jgi:hypothetical protein